MQYVLNYHSLDAPLGHIKSDVGNHEILAQYHTAQFFTWISNAHNFLSVFIITLACGFLCKIMQLSIRISIRLLAFKLIIFAGMSVPYTRKGRF